MNKLIFPRNFLWGAATSSHQVEGHNHNDWSRWEKETADSKVKHAKYQTWPDDLLKKYPSPLVKENYISDQACDHYHRFEEDFDLAQSLHHSAHRFSIEWSRIEPEEGKFDGAEIKHYQKVILALRTRGIEPFVNLWHWTNPTWFAEKKGFLKKENIKYFVRFVSYCAKQFKDVKFFITLNEPDIYTLNSYLQGLWPPQKTSLVESIEVYLNLIQAHKQAYDEIKKINPQAMIGIAKNNAYFEIGQSSVINRFLKKMADCYWNHYFLKKTADKLDFIGLNYYFHIKIQASLLRSPLRWFSQNKPSTLNPIPSTLLSDLGWEIYPKGIYKVLKDLGKYNKPIYITENGLANHDDSLRADFIKEHLFWINRAIREDINVRGYFYWSLLDNFEWDKGFWPRFGLIEIDYQTMKRTTRPSALIYDEIIKNNYLEI